MAAWNAEETLHHSVASVLDQDFSDLELIIIDDASTDRTLEVARQLQERDQRVKIVTSSYNSGPAAARNAGFDAATGDWIGIVDSDDSILRTRFSEMLWIANATSVDIVFDNLFSNLGRRQQLYIPLDCRIFGHLSLTTFIASHSRSCKIPNLGYLKPMIRASAIKRSNIRYDASLQIGEDAKLIMDLMANGSQAYLVPEAYYCYRRRSGSISSKQNLGQVRAINDALTKYLKEYGEKLTQSEQEAVQALREDNRLRIEAKYFVDLLIADKNVRKAIVLEFARRTLLRR